jgi:hypothetical protein
MTRPTGMDLVDHILVTVHGRGYHQRYSARNDISPPHVSPLYLHMVWISPQDHRHSTLQLSRVAPTVEPTSLPTSPFSRQASQEEILHEVTFAREERNGTLRTGHTFTRGTPIPPPVGSPSLQGWLSDREVPQNLPHTITSSSHAPTNRISVREGVFQPSNDAFRHRLLSHRR